MKFFKTRPKLLTAAIMAGVWLVLFLVSDVLALFAWSGLLTGACAAVVFVLLFLSFRAHEWGGVKT